MQVQSVLFITTSFPRYPRDFAGSFIFRFAKYLAKDGLKVIVLAPAAPGYPNHDIFENVEIYRFPYFYPQTYQSMAYNKGILANIRYSWLAKIQIPFFLAACVKAIYCYQDKADIIHCHWLPTAVAALTARFLKHSGIGIVFTNWGSDTRLLPKWLCRHVLKKVDGVISTALETDAHLKELRRIEFRKIPAPVDEDRFKKERVSNNMRQELKIAENIPVIAFIARLDSNKDPLTFIHACAILKDQGISFIGAIAGDGELMERCRQTINQYVLQDKVLLLGMRNDPERLLKISRISVHISSVENTWSNAIAEAMFMEVPVILSNAGYTGQVFTDYKDSLIVPAENPYALASALKYLLEDEMLCKKLVSGAKDLLRKYKKESHSIIQETRSYYDEIFCRSIKRD